MGTKETNQPTRRGTLTRKWGRWTEKYDEASASKVKIDTVYLSIIYSWEPPHAIPNSLLIALKAGFPHQFLRLFMDTSLPSSLKQQMLFRPLSWLLRRLRLFWWSPSFLRSPPLSSRTCSSFSLNCLNLCPWLALWASFPLLSLEWRCSPELYLGAAPLLVCLHTLLRLSPAPLWPKWSHANGFQVCLNSHLSPSTDFWTSTWRTTGHSYSTLSPVESITIGPYSHGPSPSISQWPKLKPGVIGPSILSTKALSVSQISILLCLCCAPSLLTTAISSLVISWWVPCTHICSFAYHPDPSSTLWSERSSRNINMMSLPYFNSFSLSKKEV